MMDNELQQFRQQIADHFSLDELEALTFDLRLNWDELGGQTLSAKIISLIVTLHHQNRLPDLITYLSQARPHLIWPTSTQIVEYLSPQSLPSAPISSPLDRSPSFIGNAQSRRSRHDERERRNELALLHKVRTFWVEGVLNRSVHGMALLDLGKQEEAEAVDKPRPWEMVLEMPDEPERPLPPDSHIIDIYDELDREMERTLLILGAPGSGKTTTLLELARDTILRAEQNANLPLPVVFNLSSWGEKQQPLAEWLVDDLNLKYQIPKNIGQEWVANDDLLLLLDGLDEVKSELRDNCVQAINAFRQEHGLAPIVVCSRVEEYEMLLGRLQFQRAIRLLPLRPEQIDTYLEMAGETLASLRLALTQDGTLREMAQSPLMLSIMSLAYRDIPIETFVTEALATTEARRTHLFDAYVERMLRRRGAHQEYTPEQTMSWLSWLAQNMAKHSQSVFLLEQLQPSWLSNRRWRWRYLLLEHFVEGVLLYGVLWALLASAKVTFADTLLIDLLIIPGIAIALVMVIKMIVWWQDMPANFAYDSSQAGEARKRRFAALENLNWSYKLVAGEMLLGLLLLIFFGSFWLFYSLWELISERNLLGLAYPNILWSSILGLLGGGTLGVLLGLPTNIIFALRQPVQAMRNAIRTRENLIWSWRDFGVKFLWLGLLPLGLVFMGTSLNYQQYREALQNSAILYDVPAGNAIATLSNHNYWVRFASFSADGRFLLTTDWGDNVRLWHGQTGTEIATLTKPGSDTTSANFSPDGRFVLTLNRPFAVHLWQAETGAEISDLESEPARSATFSPEGRFILTVNRNDIARLWDGQTGVRIATLNGRSAAIAWARFSPDGRFILTTDRDGTVRLWDGETGTEVIRLDEHIEPIDSEDFSPDGRFMLTISGDNMAQLWHVETGTEVAALVGHTDKVSSAHFSPDGRVIVTSSRDATVRLWDGESGNEIAVLTGHTIPDFVADLVATKAHFSPDGRFLLTTGWDNTARLWDSETGAEVAILAAEEGATVRSASFSPDGRFIVTSVINGDPSLWDGQTGSEIATLTGHTGIVETPFSPDGDSIVTVGDGDPIVRLWDGRTGNEITSVTSHADSIASAHLSPNGSRLLIVSARSGQDYRPYSLLALIPGLLVAMLYGFRSRVLETKKVPNQGIRLTLRNGFLMAIAGGSVISLPTLLVGGMSGWLASLPLAGLIGYYIFVWYAGIYVMRHYVLRLILILSGCTPRQYVDFLDYATDRIFLQKIGGGYYIFIHRLLLEYFASRGVSSDSSNEAAGAT